MKQTLLVLFGILLIFTSCSYDESLPNSEIKYIAGKVENIAEGTTPGTGFLVQVKTPNDVLYDATVLDTTKRNDFEIGKTVMLKGLATDNFLHVEKIIGVDIENFNLIGLVETIEPSESGYLVKVNDNDDELYSANFSLSNLGDKYIDFEVGDTLNIVGELWLFDNEMMLTVKEINN